MSQGLILDIDHIANNIQKYIDQDNFYDVIDSDIIPQVFEKTNLNSNDFRILLSQGKSKYSTTMLYKFARKCNVFINSFQDAINVLQIYNNLFKLKSSRSLIDYFEKFNGENQSDSKEMRELKNKIQNLESKLFVMEKEINEYRMKENQHKNEFAEISELRSNSDFDSVYNFLKQLSDQGDKLKMSISCAVGLSEKRNLEECTPLLLACIKGDLQLTKSLIEGGCERNSIETNGNNCLLLASFYGHLEIVKYLINIGYDKDWCNKTNGFNAIIFASQEGRLETVKYLQSIGCDVNYKPFTSASCIYLASYNGHLETVKYLLSVGANPNEKLYNGFSPLIVASSFGHLEVVKCLIQCGCNKNDKTNCNQSALHCAAKNGHFEVVEYLVSIYVNLNDIDSDEKTALDYATKRQYENDNYRKIVNLLNRSGAQYFYQ
ncbi:KIAA1250 protein, putative [Trichomonas vaginalis G3]|uniref:KIAA1250 protein, putative n=1 Tax=Trichomonas vaginalis (strain ATCC PRA-98 / G3) TaxID=412133 RepID=A2DF60_TRIV3|nr:protein ubiquitination [Trichomonas vaginalis G3]EAY21052.1 KIAA1250 protein, putative [Trichomonas vaginalis G3]KAI5519236.1 protein ubiquitination [Trichomonas vaginalis G3]|eukprot:XP_001582038.1 KIAA1250 protein [Trichomonas vaginalis G3]